MPLDMAAEAFEFDQNPATSSRRRIPMFINNHRRSPITANPAISSGTPARPVQKDMHPHLVLLQQFQVNYQDGLIVTESGRLFT